MGRQIILSEQEKKNIQKMYGFINENEESNLPSLEDMEVAFKEIFGDDLEFSDLNYGYDENPLKMGVAIEGQPTTSDDSNISLDIHAGNYCDNKKGIEVTLYYMKDGNYVNNTICGSTIEDITRQVESIYNEMCNG